MPLGWYAYAFAGEPFVVSAVATYVPIFLEQLARRNAVSAVDKTTPCLTPPGPGPPLPNPGQKCVLKVLWFWIDTTSLPLYTFSVSVLVQTLVVVSMSLIADRGAHRKRLLVGFAVAGSLCTIAMAFISHKRYYVAALLAVASNASFGAVSVCGNAYLLPIVAQICGKANQRTHTLYDRFYGACPRLPMADPSKVASRVSGNGVAIGYGAALFVQLVTMALVSHLTPHNDSQNVLQLAILFVGVWWLVFQIPVVLYLDEIEQRTPRASRGLWSDVRESWRSLFRTFAKAQELRDVSIFLVGWFLISDTIVTINSSAVLFARANLNMATPALALIGLLSVVFGIFGSLVSGRLFTSRSSAGIVSVALVTSLIPLYGVAGFFFNRLGLHHPYEMYVLAAVYGSALGALNTLCRSVYSLLIPHGHETMFFALFAVTDKGSSILGPFVTGLITDRTHNIRYTFYFLLLVSVLSAFVFSNVDVDRGRVEAQVLETEEEEEDLSDFDEMQADIYT